MKCADALISDYSGAAYEYLQLDRPIGYVLDDVNDYIAGFVVEDIHTLIAGAEIYNFEQLESFIVNVVSENDSFKERREKIRNYIYEYHDANSSEVSKRIGKLKEMRRLTEATMRGEIPFRTSFLNRVKILSDISVAEVNQVVSEIPLNPYIAEFIEQNRDRCYVVTGNLDVWISGLMKKLKMENHCYCSKADVICAAYGCHWRWRQ